MILILLKLYLQLSFLLLVGEALHEGPSLLLLGTSRLLGVGPGDVHAQGADATVVRKDPCVTLFGYAIERNCAATLVSSGIQTLPNGALHLWNYTQSQLKVPYLGTVTLEALVHFFVALFNYVQVIAEILHFLILHKIGIKW